MKIEKIRKKTGMDPSTAKLYRHYSKLYDLAKERENNKLTGN
jgi:hypothetical protein